ncbi:hypothetical protein SF1_08780 [Sphingobacterium faecium NBRC 15299]|uniref:hypothetical protein n=1 Tax=Sphingobacterium faecium TaxID=34087 RepID=UPI000D408559|nr:hypothetical protein [Sphingobacterium faecium]PTX11025.1 hypothetical protein C8N37_104306 [Sphingobacterium faecium]GEM62896.1 hypothetical protein SF1_08780 [Sphingobacterium faecium NBRC 15299]
MDNTISIARINERSISAEELKFYMSLEKANTVNYFFQKYKAEVDQRFWNLKFDQEVPIEFLRNSAWHLIQKDQRIKQLALDNRLLEKADFASLLEAMEEENKVREQMIQEHKIIYGPTKFDRRSYYFYYMSQLENQLKKIGIVDFDQPLDITLDSVTFHQMTL